MTDSRPGRGAGRPGPAGSKSVRGLATVSGRGADGAPAPGRMPRPGADRNASRLPPVRLAPREELAVAARVVPLLRAARELRAWIGEHPAAGGVLDARQARAAARALDLTRDELHAAWQVVAAAGPAGAGRAGAGRAAAGPAVPGPALPAWDKPLASCDAEEVLREWDAALAALLAAEELDALATALYTVGAPVRIDALFDAYSAAAGPATDGPAVRSGGAGRDAGALSRALETLADLGVVELGTEETAGGLTVALSPLGVWGVHRRLLAQGWHVPVLGGADPDSAVALLMTLASCDAEDGEAHIGSWLAGRVADQAAAELIAAAAGGSPGLRGAAFAVLDRIGPAAAGAIRTALGDPLLRAHAAVWLHEQGEQAELGPADRMWLLVDLGAGLLEEADARDVVAELLPDVPPQAQADIVAGLWEVDHPAVIDLLTTLGEHHQDADVARAARKAALKARSVAVTRQEPTARLDAT